MSIKTRDWEADYRAGQFDFLAAPDEQLRHAVIATLVESHGPGDVIDLGAGPGFQRRWLHPRFCTRYVAVDVSRTALDKLPAGEVPAETVCTSIESFTPPARPIGSIVCAEVLYALEHPGRELARIAAAAPSVGAVIVTLLAARPDKPNWAKGSAIVWAELESLGWPVVERVSVRASTRGIGWDIAVLKPRH